MKIGFIVLPLWLVAGAGMAQDAEKQAEPAVPQAAAAPADAAKAARRQGADMRHCLEKKDSKAIIRCAEPGRKP